ncbi:hypothetical protein AQUCO_01900076v1 [Aquilegia coerulea]|uniref:Uncharacterized protein n=1 Tax=Aquilegia coerulea TaxID=218851 RepID=A0A2G5DIY9_AQUCA|nr:hypothetical protein AQUCO_01900076v1 [Aquilegia coerulea]
MAEINETKSISSIQDEQKPNQNPFISLLHNLQLNFPQFNNKQNNNNNKVVSTQVVTTKEKVETENQKPDFVRIPDCKKDFPALTLEGDESQEQANFAC